MKLRRFLRPESVCLELETRAIPGDRNTNDGDSDDFDETDKRNLNRIRESVAAELTTLFEATGAVANPRKLTRELYDREKKAPTALGGGIALPHLRTLQAKSFVMAFARSTEGLPFGAPDDEPVHLFFAMIAPPYDDRTYLRVYKSLAKFLLQPDAVERLRTVDDEHLVLRYLEEIQ